MFCKQKFRMSKVCISQKVKGLIMRNLRGTIFCMKKYVLKDFYICISAPLTERWLTFYENKVDSFD